MKSIIAAYLVCGLALSGFLAAAAFEQDEVGEFWEMQPFAFMFWPFVAGVIVYAIAQEPQP